MCYSASKNTLRKVSTPHLFFLINYFLLKDNCFIDAPFVFIDQGPPHFSSKLLIFHYHP